MLKMFGRSIAGSTLPCSIWIRVMRIKWTLCKKTISSCCPMDQLLLWSTTQPKSLLPRCSVLIDTQKPHTLSASVQRSSQSGVVSGGSASTSVAFLVRLSAQKGAISAVRFHSERLFATSSHALNFRTASPPKTLHTFSQSLMKKA